MLPHNISHLLVRYMNYFWFVEKPPPPNEDVSSFMYLTYIECRMTLHYLFSA